MENPSFEDGTLRLADGYAHRLDRRWTAGRPHRRLKELLDASLGPARERLKRYAAHESALAELPMDDTPPPASRFYWRNGFFSMLDAVVLYGLLAEVRPRLYLEIGSGSSTRLARHAVPTEHLETRMVSIDPHPRAEVDQLCDEVVRRGLEEVGLEVFTGLQSGDILFFDGSHRMLTNSDVTVFFLDIVPELPRAVYVHVHDIFWPEDYPEAWRERCYSEQYALGVLLLSASPGGGGHEVVSPNAHLSRTTDLPACFPKLWDRLEGSGVERGGCSFWLRT